MGKGRVLKIYDQKAVFENLDAVNNNGSHSLLVTQTDSGKKFEKFNKSTQHSDLGPSFQVIPFEAIFGFYELLAGSYVALIVESEPYVNTPIMEMRKVKKIVVVPLFRNCRTLSENKQKDEDRYLQLLNFSLTEHNFYFSHTYDITHTQQRLAKLSLSGGSSKPTSSGTITVEPSWTKADLRFFWNRDIIDELVVNEAHDWIVPMMSGYVEIRSDCSIEDIKFNLLFVSRRSKFRQGCRFTKRGIDNNGYTANFVETEQILIFPDGKVTSYVQVRGSIPLKWTSPVHMRYDPAVFIDEKKEESIQSCKLHVEELYDNYTHFNSTSTAPSSATPASSSQSVLMINLIDHKKDQGRLGTAFKEITDEVRGRIYPASLNFVWFDFHHECKQKGKWKNLSKLVLQVDEIFRAQKYFSRNGNKEITSWQLGVIRTNCMDNLDRTNVVQSLFARRSLIFQLGKASSLDMNGSHILDTPWKTFEVSFKTLWTNNANAMSLAYAGTGALKVDFTKTGKRTFKGMMNDGVNSVMRYYINNFTDGIKQDAIDLMLGRYRPNLSAPSPFSYRTSQEALSSNITKAFVLFILIFSTLALLLPPSLPYITFIDGRLSFHPNAELTIFGTSSVDRLDRNFKHLQTHFLIALLLSLAVLMYLSYKIVKKGSKIGELMVIHPELCPEPLPVGRSIP